MKATTVVAVLDMPYSLSMDARHGTARHPTSFSCHCLVDTSTSRHVCNPVCTACASLPRSFHHTRHAHHLKLLRRSFKEMRTALSLLHAPSFYNPARRNLLLRHIYPRRRARTPRHFLRARHASNPNFQRYHFQALPHPFPANVPACGDVISALSARQHERR